jgi:hypothetical protein
MTTLKQQVKDGQLKWRKGVDPTDTNSANEYIEFRLLEYEYYDLKDDLWAWFQEEFTGFTEEILEACHQPTINQLHTLLRDRGVWVLKDKNTSVAKSLRNTIIEEEPIQWTREELLDDKSLNPTIVSYLLRHAKETTLGSKHLRATCHISTRRAQSQLARAPIPL